MMIKLSLVISGCCRGSFVRQQMCSLYHSRVMCTVMWRNPPFRLCSASKASQPAWSSEDRAPPFKVRVRGREAADANAMIWARGMVPPLSARPLIVRSVTDVIDNMRDQALSEMEQHHRLSLRILGSASASSSKVRSMTGQFPSPKLTSRPDSGANAEMKPAEDAVLSESTHNESSSGQLPICESQAAAFATTACSPTSAARPHTGGSSQ